jgi:hypothetical protein
MVRRLYIYIRRVQSTDWLEWVKARASDAVKGARATTGGEPSRNLALGEWSSLLRARTLISSLRDL